MNSCYMSKLKNNQQGFSLLEMLVATAISLVLLSVIVFVFDQQKTTYSQQNEVGEMQANSRATVDLISRLVQNSGYNITRGTRFLAASDRYLSAVFDENDDGNITNNEVFVLALSNGSGTNTSTFTISPYFDSNLDGKVASTETGTYTIGVRHATLPLNMYYYTPDVGATTTTRSLVAENIENLVIRYYDKNDSALPSAGPFTGGEADLPFTVPASELNDIRRVSIEVIARSNKPDPRGNTRGGTYQTNSVAAQVAAATSYNDQYFRSTYSTNASPRNLVAAAWGKIDMEASVTEVSCPSVTSTVTSNLVDQNGAPLSGASMSYSTSDGALSTPTGTTDGTGAASTNITYDWTEPSVTATISASTLVTVNSEPYPVYSAMPVAFTSPFTEDTFTDLDASDWNDVGVVSFDASAGDYKTTAAGIGETTNGCTAWKDYNTQVAFQDTGAGMTIGDFGGVMFRYTDTNNYYILQVAVIDVLGTPTPTLQLVKMETGTPTVLGSYTIPSYALDTLYQIKAQAVGDELKARIWLDSASEPATWDIEVTDATFTSGQMGLMTNVDTNVFDDIAITTAS